jgi:uncharacterized protein (DUF885 family)
MRLVRTSVLLLRAALLLAAGATLAAAPPAAAQPTAAQPTAAQPAAPAVAAGRQLDSLAEAYFEELLPLNPTLATAIGDRRYDDRYVAPFADSVRGRQREVEERYHRRLLAIPRAALDEQHRLTYDVMRTSFESAARLRPFPAHLLPLNPMFNFTAAFVQLGAGTGAQPFATVRDYDAFLRRARGFEQAVDVAIGNMRRGAAAGVVQPRVLMERVLPQLSAHVVTRAESSLFWHPVAAMPQGFPAADRARLTAAYRERIERGIVPAFRRLHDFVRDEYLPRTRATAGLSALPNGAAWYEASARASTTTALTADEIHRIGLAEVARIHAAMDSVRRQVGYAGTLREFFQHLQTESRFRYATREEMLADYRAAQARIDPLTDRLFDVKPKATYEIRPVEPFRERSFAGGAYQAASPDGTRPGIFYLNTYDPPARARFGMESLLLHEGSPGHHFQITVQRELESLPRVRRFGGFTAYSEGWGLYAESLGRELGVYTDPYQYFGALAGELWRAIRLVLDTGIHAKGWTREQAIRYALDNSSNSETSTVSEVERFMSIPGQALAYKIGQMKITELRRRAERELGPKFDVKAFHRAVLVDGALPLDALEAKIDRWIAQRR